jgi:dsRNA-specific ribonuclease
VIAAVYIDGGFQASFKLIQEHFSDLLNSIAAPAANNDYKSQLQELAQLTHKVIPVYRVVYESGPDHNKTFGVQLSVCDIRTDGTGKSKKTAEQDAARKALEILARKESASRDAEV